MLCAAGIACSSSWGCGVPMDPPCTVLGIGAAPATAPAASTGWFKHKPKIPSDANVHAVFES